MAGIVYFTLCLNSQGGSGAGSAHKILGVQLWPRPGAGIGLRSPWPGIGFDCLAVYYVVHGADFSSSYGGDCAGSYDYKS